LQFRRCIKVVRRWTTLQCAESDVPSREWRYVGELVRTNGELFVVARDDSASRPSVRFLARSRVELIRLERTVFARLLVDGKRFRSGGVELESDVRDVEAFSQMKGEIDRVGKLHSLQHRFRLPIRHVRVVVKVRKIARRMSSVRIRCVAKIARTRCTSDSGLSAVLDGRNSAGVRGLDELVESGVDKRRDASLRFASIVVTTRRSSRVPIRLGCDSFACPGLRKGLTRGQFGIRFEQ
jgi:hypothetical protein